MSVRTAGLMRRRGTWVLAAAAVVLGGASTAAAGAAGVFQHSGTAGAAGCRSAALPGSVVDVTVTDMRMGAGPGMGGGGGMMGGSYRGGTGWMSVAATPGTVPAGTVSLRVANIGVRTHEVLVLPLPDGRTAGQRAIGADGRVDESSSLGEASRTCAEGAGDGISAGATGWVTFTLPRGRYELLCNIPGHYQAGAYTELDVS